MRATISRAEVFALCRSLGAEPTETSRIEVLPGQVEITTYLLRDGSLYVDEETGEAAVQKTEIPIVGEGDAVTVPMRHPDLPGRVIDVRPRSVGQRAMAGWEVVGPPPNDDSPPDSGTPEAPAEPGASSSATPRGRRTKKKEEDG